MSDADRFNKVTIVFEWPADKWMGYADWVRDVEVVESVAVRIGLDDGRPTMTVTREWIDDDA